MGLSRALGTRRAEIFGTVAWGGPSAEGREKMRRGVLWSIVGGGTALALFPAQDVPLATSLESAAAAVAAARLHVQQFFLPCTS